VQSTDRPGQGGGFDRGLSYTSRTLQNYKTPAEFDVVVALQAAWLSDGEVHLHGRAADCPACSRPSVDEPDCPSPLTYRATHRSAGTTGPSPSPRPVEGAYSVSIQWRYVRIASEVTLRDWSPDPTFVWDGTVPGLASVPTSAEVAALARSTQLLTWRDRPPP
jgi:hypothetical protein